MRFLCCKVPTTEVEQNHYCLVIVEYGDSKFDHRLMSVTCLWLGQIITGLEEVIVGMKPGGLSIATQSKVCVYGESVVAVVTN